MVLLPRPCHGGNRGVLMWVKANILSSFEDKTASEEIGRITFLSSAICVQRCVHKWGSVQGWADKIVHLPLWFSHKWDTNRTVTLPNYRKRKEWFNLVELESWAEKCGLHADCRVTWPWWVVLAKVVANMLSQSGGEVQNLQPALQGPSSPVAASFSGVTFL